MFLLLFEEVKAVEWASRQGHTELQKLTLGSGDTNPELPLRGSAEMLHSCSLPAAGA